LTKTVSENIDRLNRTEGGTNLLKNLAASVEGPNVWGLQRGELKAYFFRGPADSTGKRPWRWTNSKDVARAGGPGVALTEAYPGPVATGQEGNAKELAAIALQLDAFNTGDATAVKALADRQRQIREHLDMTESMHLQASKALMEALSSVGFLGPTPLRAGRDFTVHPRAVPPITNSSEAMEWCMNTLLVGTGDARLGVYVAEDTGCIKSVSDGTQLWPRAGETADWRLLAKTSPMEAVGVLLHMPSPPANAAFMKSLREGMQNLCLPQSLVSLPADVARAQQRQRLLRSLISNQYLRTMMNLEMRHRSARGAYTDTLDSMPMRPDVVFFWGVSGTAGADKRRFAVNWEIAERCEKNYKSLLDTYSRDENLDDQMDRLLRLEAETEDKSFAELRALYGNAINRLNKIEKFLQSSRKFGAALLDATGNEWLRRGLESGVDLLNGEDPEKVLKEAVYDITEDVAKDKIKKEGKKVVKDVFGKKAGKGLEKVLKAKGKVEKIMKVGEALYEGGSAIIDLINDEGSVPVIRMSAAEEKSAIDTKTKSGMDAFKKLKADAEASSPLTP
jgi:hypothetical protein